MTRLWRRGRAALLGLALLAAAVGFGWSVPTSAHAAACTSPDVAVLVDLSHWGGSERAGCVRWSSSLTGVSALTGAGFSPTGTRQYGLAFICRINGYPSAGAPDHESCNSTPSATKYWSYWHAEAGQSSWTYSTLGAASYHPQAGSVDAWTFGAGAAPPVAPSAVLPGASSAPTSHASTSKSVSAPATRTQSSSTHRSTGRSTAPVTHRSAPAAPKSQSTKQGGAASSASGAPPTTNTTDTTNTSPTTNSAGAAVPSSATAGSTSAALGSSGSSGTGPVTIAIGRTPVIVSNRSSDVASSKAGGSPGPTIAGAAVVAVLAAGGAFYAWRRRGSRSHAG